MKVFVLLQDTYCEGNFGDTELAQTIIHGIFSTKEKATKVMLSLPKTKFYSHREDGKKEPYFIVEKEIDKYKI